jgi:hypothetical protein
MGATTYLVLKAGILTITQSTSAGASGPITNEATWLVAFFAGFSDRFSERLLRLLAGHFGGDKAGELVSMRVAPEASSSGILDRLSEAFKRTKGAAKETNEPAPVTPQVSSLVPAKSKAASEEDQDLMHGGVEMHF